MALSEKEISVEAAPVKLSYFRGCPTCGRENAPETLRCACGALLTGVDLTPRLDEANVKKLASDNADNAQRGNPSDLDADAEIAVRAEETSRSLKQKPPSEAQLCPYPDCAQPNPPHRSHCVYCNRELSDASSLPAPSPQLLSEADFSDLGQSLTHFPADSVAPACLFTLPSALRARFAIDRALPATGAEADLFVVSPLAGGEQQIVKIYRHGIHPNREVAERSAQISRKNRVEIRESGFSDGFAYELMEFCRAGSLRDLLSAEQVSPELLRQIISELTQAIDNVHRAGLIHRDLKPENILVRQPALDYLPLDLVLTDFGIASLQNATHSFTSNARTLAYGAPETLSGVINSKADWWSLGMIILESALGIHPFYGLSDAVILHHLTTRAIHLDGVNDSRLKNLLRGLLQRNPETRWGVGEVERWLEGDTTLPEIRDESQTAEARAPYQIGTALCYTADQLAVGLAQHWVLASADLDNGLLSSWFRDSLRDQNRVRFLIELKLERTLHVDVRLLRLILDLAPSIAPVWRGESLNLASLLSYASRALKKEDDALQFLSALFEHRVLPIYASAGNAEMAEIAARWETALTDFYSAWEALTEKIVRASKARAQPISTSELLYGVRGPTRPVPRQMHAQLLALAYDKNWVARLRQRLAVELPRLALDQVSESLPHQPHTSLWFLGLGKVDTLDAPALLALDNLLPAIRQDIEQRAALAKRQEANATVHRTALGRQARLIFERLSAMPSSFHLSEDFCEELRRQLQQLSEVNNQLIALGRSVPIDAEEQHLRTRLARAEPLINRLQPLISELEQRRAKNRGWFNLRVLFHGADSIGFFRLLLGATVAIRLLLNAALFIPTLVGLFFFGVWRYTPNFFTQREIKALVKKISLL